MSQTPKQPDIGMLWALFVTIVSLVIVAYSCIRGEHPDPTALPPVNP